MSTVTPHLIFFRCVDHEALLQKLNVGWSWEVVENLRLLDEATVGERDPVVLTSFNDSVYWEFWMESHPGFSVMQVRTSEDDTLLHGFTDWISPSIGPEELNLRIYYGLIKSKEQRKIVDMADRIKKEQRIQLEMNDRLLKVSMELKEAKEKIEELSMTDALTQVRNRRFFDFQIQRDILQSTRYRTELSIFMMDLDNFKSVNDRFGHQVGDEVLVRLGDIIRTCLRDTDWVARYGGEEFVVVLPMTDQKGALMTAERMREQVEHNLSQLEGEALTTSVGLATFEGGLSLEEFIRNADEALYRGKGSGKNKVVYYDNDRKEICDFPIGAHQSNPG